MIGLKKRDMKKLLEAGAKARGISIKDMREQIQATIDEAMSQKFRRTSKGILATKAPHQKNISIRLRERQRFEKYLFATCMADQQKRYCR